MNLFRLQQLAGIKNLFESQVLLEANVLNAKNDFVINLPEPVDVGAGENITRITIPVYGPYDLGDEEPERPEIKKWLKTVLNKYIINNADTINFSHNDPIHFSKEYLQRLFLWFEVDQNWIDRNIDAIWDSMPNYAKTNNPILLGMGFAGSDDQEALLDFYGNFFPSPEVTQQLTDYLEYRLLNNQPIEHLTVPDALRLSDEWHNQPSQKNAKEKARIDQIQEDRDYKVIYTFPDGFQMVRLLSVLSLDHETFYLDHCIGKGSYDKKVTDPNYRYISLWNTEKTPFGTFELKKAGNDWIVTQLQGYKNGRIAEEVHNHFQQFITKAHLKFSGDVLKNINSGAPVNLD